MTRDPGPENAARRPYCDSHGVARILYGFIIPDEELTKALELGKVLSGWCRITDHDPVWQYDSCAATFGLSRHLSPPEAEEQEDP